MRRASRPHQRGAVLALGVAMLVGTPALGAQSAPARIEGRIIDSLDAHAADGAIVQAVRISPAPQTFSSVRADAAGGFSFDSLQAGRYWLSFGSPLLDSLSVVIPEREVTVDAGARVHVELAIPSSARLRAALCPGIQLEAGHGAVVGDVMDASTDRPLAGATVVVAWNDLRVDRATLAVTNEPHVGALAADSAGHYRLCGVPTDLPLRLQVQRGSASSAVVEAMVSEGIGVLRQDLSMGADAPALAASDTGARAAGRPSTTGSATVSGVVTGTDGRPLSGVDVRIAGAEQGARTDTTGRYRLAGLPSGTQMLEARKVGYFKRRVVVQLRDAREVRQPVRLARVVSLDSIRIVGQRSRLGEFDERRRRNAVGTFLEFDQILASYPLQTSDLFRRIPGFRLQNDTLVSTRGGRMFNNCPANVVIDGMQHMDINIVEPTDIAAMEVYRGNAGAPLQYESACGLIVIWTKR